MTQLAVEFGRLVRTALGSWARTIRLGLLLLFVAAAAALFFALLYGILPSWQAPPGSH